jgi:hypothetical protein
MLCLIVLLVHMILLSSLAMLRMGSNEKSRLSVVGHRIGITRRREPLLRATP